MDEPLLPYAAVILKLLRGVVYADDNSWETLLTYQQAVRQYVAGIGLVLHVDETDGYAYLTHPEAGDDEATSDTGAAPLPRRVRRPPDQAVGAGEGGEHRARNLALDRLAIPGTGVR